jgi:hypothetical protein
VVEDGDEGGDVGAGDSVGVGLTVLGIAAVGGTTVTTIDVVSVRVVEYPNVAIVIVVTIGIVESITDGFVDSEDSLFEPDVAVIFPAGPVGC